MLAFLADMGVSPRTVAVLIAAGFDAVHGRDLGLGQADDAQILARAASERRVVLTFDLDFGDILAASGGTSPSVIIIRTTVQTPTVVNPLLLAVIAKQHEALTEGCLIVIDDSCYRLRHLPVRARPN
jgi:predicted nuclease of predicted toxin-antitoxin system